MCSLLRNVKVFFLLLSLSGKMSQEETARDLQRDFIPERIHVGKNDLREGI